jgi:hypothetical protein
MMDLLTAIRRIRKRLKINRRHKAGRVPTRRKKRGRPRKSRTWRNDFLYQNAHLLVMRPERLSRNERATLEKLFELDPRLSTIRDFATELHGIFKARTRQSARNRRTRLLKNFRFPRERLLKNSLKRLENDSVFERLIVSLSWYRVPRTNNHVERCNRAFRLVQKTRYKRRRHYMIKRAYWLHLLRDWQDHPLVLDRAARPKRIRRKAGSQRNARAVRRCAHLRRPVRRSA